MFTFSSASLLGGTGFAGVLGRRGELHATVSIEAMKKGKHVLMHKKEPLWKDGVPPAAAGRAEPRQRHNPWLDAVQGGEGTSRVTRTEPTP
jgi:hypothetical protein